MQPVLLFDEGLDELRIQIWTCADNWLQVNGQADISLDISQDRDHSVALDAFGLMPETIRVFPSVGASCNEIKDRGLDGNVDFPDGRGNDDLEIVIDHIDSQVRLLFPEEAEPMRLRHRMNTLGFVVSSSASADRSSEDHDVTTLHKTAPAIETRTAIREHGTPFYPDWHRSLDIPPDAVVDCLVEIEITGEESIFITVDDSVVAVPGLSVSIDPNSLNAMLYRDGDEEGVPVTASNAASFGFHPSFFTGSPLGFVYGVQHSQPRYFGQLLAGGGCAEEWHPGDKLVLEFQLRVIGAPGYCQPVPRRARIVNRLSVSGGIKWNSGVTVVNDIAGSIDTDEELANGEDDGMTWARVHCPD